MATPLPFLQPKTRITFARFWPAFMDQNACLPSDREDFILWFEELLGPITAPTPEEATPERPASWVITSVFQGREPSREVAPGANKYAVAYLSYSGECHYNTPLTAYDANLIMRATDPTARTVCLPLFAIASHVRGYLSLYRRSRPLPPPNVPRNFCAFVISNPSCKTRNVFAAMLNSYKPIHSAGGALNTTGYLAPRIVPEYLKLLSNFKFNLCFENQSSPTYLTEKLMHAWLGNTIPIYWGASRAQTWLNPKAFLQLPDVPTEDDMRELVARVAYLDQNPEAYAAMFREPLILPDAQLPRELSLDAIREDLVACLRRSRGPPPQADALAQP